MRLQVVIDFRYSRGSVRLSVETSKIGYNQMEVNQWYLTKTI